jgi:hypothetical protein
MADKPKRASEYESEQVELVRATCLYVATKLGDMMDDLLIIGGLVPSPIVDQVDLPEGTDAHVGTMDLDIGLQLALLDEGRYRTSRSDCAMRASRWTRTTTGIPLVNAGRSRAREP